MRTPLGLCLRLVLVLWISACGLPPSPQSSDQPTATPALPATILIPTASPSVLAAGPTPAPVSTDFSFNLGAAAEPSRTSHLYPPNNLVHFDRMAWSTDGQLFAAIGPLGLLVYQVQPLSFVPVLEVRFDDEEWGSSLAFQPTSHMLATGHENGSVKIWNPPDTAPVRVLQGQGDRVHDLAWTSDGQGLVSAADWVGLWDAGAGQVVRRMEGRAYDPMFSPDDSILYARLGSDGTPSSVDLSKEGESWVPLTGCFAWDWPAAATGPDGLWVVAAGGDSEPKGSLCGWDTSSGELVFTMQLDWRAPTQLAVSPDGLAIATEFGLGPVALLRRTDSQLITVLESTIGTILDIAFHPDGEMLAEMGAGGDIQLWDLRRVLGQPSPWPVVPDETLVTLSKDEAEVLVDPPLRLTDSEPWKEAPLWSPRGDAIVYRSFWGVDTGVDLMLLACLHEDAWPAGGPAAVCAQGSRRLEALDLLTPAAWSPDGTQLILADVRDLYVHNLSERNSYTVPSADPRGFADKRRPVWSPEGRWIAYVSQRVGGTDADLFLFDTVGHVSLSLSTSGSEEDYPAWSTRGALAFVSDRNGSQDVFIALPDSTPAEVAVPSDGRDETRPAWSPDGERLAMVSFPYGSETDGEIWVIDEGTMHLTRLAGLAPAHGPLAWSPGGEWIAFVSGADEDADIFAVDPDGSRLLRITGSPGADRSPGWSPAGDLVAFRCERNGSGEICLASLETGRFPPYPIWSADFVAEVPVGYDYEVHWTDGGRLAYAANAGREGDRVANFEIFTAALDGSQVRRLTQSASAEYSPTWSPDGSSIAFVSEPEDPAEYIHRLHSVGADGGAVQLILPDLARAPAWSPLGTWIAFERLSESGSDLYLVQPDGTGLRPLTQGPTDDTAPSWSPDGRRVAFVSYDPAEIPYEDRSIFVKDIESNDPPRLLADQYESDVDPRWAPNGDWVAFASRRRLGETDLFMVSVDKGLVYRLTDTPWNEQPVGWTADGSSLLFVVLRGGGGQLYQIEFGADFVPP